MELVIIRVRIGFGSILESDSNSKLYLCRNRSRINVGVKVRVGVAFDGSPALIFFLLYCVYKIWCRFYSRGFAESLRRTTTRLSRVRIHADFIIYSLWVGRGPFLPPPTIKLTHSRPAAGNRVVRNKPWRFIWKFARRKGEKARHKQSTESAIRVTPNANVHGDSVSALNFSTIVFLKNNNLNTQIYENFNWKYFFII